MRKPTWPGFYGSGKSRTGQGNDLVRYAPNESDR